MRTETICIEDLGGCKELYLSRPNPHNKAFIIIIILLLVLTVLWMSVFKIDITVNAIGVSKDSGASTIYNTTNGKIKEIYANNNTYVKKGEKLYELDSESLDYRIGYYEDVISNFEEKRDMLLAYINWLNDDNFDFHSFSNNKYFNQINTKKIIIESTLIKKNYDNSFQSAIYESNSDFINSSISDKKDALKNYTQVLEDIKNRNNTFSEGLYYYIVEDYIIGYVSIESKYEKEKSESSEEELISYETQSLLEIEQTIEQIEDDIINLENEKETIQRKLEGLSNDYIDELACKIIINEEIDLSYSLIENCDSEIKQNEFYQRQLIQEKEQSVVCATCEGTIDYKIEANINEYLTTGMAVAEVITNKREDIIVEAYVNNDDIGKIEVGMKVNCDIYAYPASEYGYITGEIVEIHNKNNDGKYTVLIDLTTVDVKTRQGDTYSLRDGLEGEVKIITDRKSILFYLIDKIDVFDDIGIE